MIAKPTATPDVNQHRWWWMRYKQTPRAKWRVMLIRLEVRDVTIYVNPWQENNYYPLSFFDDWQTTFLPAEAPPDEEAWKE